MSITDNLNNLQNNIENAKSILVNNLTEKGVTSVTTSSTLTVLATSVADIPNSGGGGNPFEEIGYTSTPEYIQDGIDYSKEIYDSWDASVTNRSFSNDKQLVYFPKVDTSNLTGTTQMFMNCTNLQYVPELDVSKVKVMLNMFKGCKSLTSIDLSNWNTSNVTSMNYMFEACSGLKSLDVSNWNTSAVTTMSYMFSGCTSLTSFDLNDWDTSNVTDMLNMFNGCESLTSLDISNWNTSNVTSMNGMFQSCSGLISLDVSSFDTSKVTNMSWMFFGCSSLTSLNVSNFNTSKVTDMSYMFYSCKSLTTLDLSSFDTYNVTNMSNMFSNCTNLEKVDGYLSFKSFSSSTMSGDYLFGYSKNTSIKKISFKDIGYNTNAKQFNMSYIENWGVNTDTILDAKQSLTDSLITYSFDRATAGYQTCTVKLSSTTKELLTEDEIAQITAKGFTIA